MVWGQSSIMKELSKVIGIISWLPDNIVDRSSRLMRFTRLLNGINEYFPDIPIMVIAQNWKNYMPQPQNNDFIIYKYDKLGILQARKELRKHFLEKNYDYLIMFDDDAIIESAQDGLVKEYFRRMDEHPNGFAFVKNWGIQDLANLNPYYPSQLNLCAISRYIYEKEPMINIDPQKDEAYEDNLWSLLLHCKYSDLEFDVPEGLRSVHFKNPNIDKLGGEVPSTWSKERKRDWRGLGQRTIALSRYIIENKDLPVSIKGYLMTQGLWRR